MNASEQEKRALRQHAHAHLTTQEEEKLTVTYLMLKRMTNCSDDQKTMDLLQVAAPAFTFTEPGCLKMARLYILWQQIRTQSSDSEDRTAFTKNIMKLCAQIDCIHEDILKR
jgi:hypothetical protein